jgi:hypothetical protein
VAAARFGPTFSKEGRQRRQTFIRQDAWIDCRVSANTADELRKKVRLPPQSFDPADRERPLSNQRYCLQYEAMTVTERPFKSRDFLTLSIPRHDQRLYFDGTRIV